MTDSVDYVNVLGFIVQMTIMYGCMLIPAWNRRLCMNHQTFRNLWPRYQMMGPFLTQIMIIEFVISCELVLIHLLVMVSLKNSLSFGMLCPFGLTLLIYILFSLTISCMKPEKMLSVMPFVECVLETRTVSVEGIIQRECMICMEMHETCLFPTYKCRCTEGPKNICSQCLQKHYEVSTSCPWCRSRMYSIVLYVSE